MNKTTPRETTIELTTNPETNSLRILVLEDNPRDVALALRGLEQAGFEIHADTVDTQKDFLAKLGSHPYDLILSDYRIPSWSGAQAFRAVKKSGIDVPFILVTGALGDEAAVDLIKEGVTDYILKDNLIRLPTSVRRALDEKETRLHAAQAIRELRMSESRAICLAESNIIGIVVGDLNGQLTEANGAFLNLVGYSRKELLAGSMRWDKMTPPEYHDVDQRAAALLKSTGAAPTWEKQLIHKEGSRVSVLIGSATIAAMYAETECVSFVLDIGEQKKLEQQLRKAENSRD
jgi:PAS domain S-box-containing protein